MFERYTPQSRRAIYFARTTAVDAGAALIDSSHILLGLLVDQESRANMLFHLRELLSEETERHRNLKHHPVGPKEPLLSSDSKRILAYTAKEADRLEDCWIDTDHFVLGILREEDCPAAKVLNRTGIQIERARQIVIENKRSRPEFGPVPGLWRRSSGKRFASWVVFWYLLLVSALLLLLLKK